MDQDDPAASTADLRRRAGRAHRAPAFGEVLTEHMVSATWSAEHGWHDTEVRRTRRCPGTGMNIFFDYGDRLVTPPLSGTLLPGVTRASVTLAREPDLKIEERALTLDEWAADCRDGAMTEAFACGMAAVVTPIGHVVTQAGDFQVGDGEQGPATRRLRTALVDLQHGRADDPHGWRHRLVGPATDRVPIGSRAAT